jgi:predicted DNA-binding transcriptional regulator AlpA
VWMVRVQNRTMSKELPTNPDWASEVAALKGQVARLLRLLCQTDAAGHALSISQFCARNNISRSFFYKLRKHGKAPRTMAVDGRRIISPEAERDWRLERERDSAEALKPTNSKRDLEDGLGAAARAGAFFASEMNRGRGGGGK